MRRKITVEELDKLKSENGGYTKSVLASLGVPWPPPKGWRKALLGYNKKKKVSKKQRQTRKKRRTIEQRKSFHKSREWKELRYKALKLYGPKCMCCGVTSNDGAIMHVDHIKSRYLHPELAWNIENLQILCASCNLGKGALDETDWRYPCAEPRLSVLMGERIE